MKDVTFCLISSGEVTEADCLTAIAPWKDQIVYQEVRNTFPQIAALNQMTSQVNTPYLVPLDADIILRPNAYDRIRLAVNKYYFDETWHSILFPLYDTLTQKRILALKVLRTSVLKEIPFQEEATPDVNHYKRLTDAGYKCITKYLDRDVIGDHVVTGRRFCYYKYRDVYQTLRVQGWGWDEGAFMGGRTLEERAKNHYDYFLTQYILTERLDYLYCIAGMIDGITSPLENKSKSLESGDYKVPTDLAIDQFVSWYKNRTNEMATFF